MMGKPFLRIMLFCTCACLLSAVADACGGDDSGTLTTPTPGSSGPPDLSPAVAGVEAARRYLQEKGVDGRMGAFTDPQSCAEIGDNTKGAFCIHENFSVFAPGLVILRVANPDNPDKEVWEVRLTKTDRGWEVTEAKPFGRDE